MLCCGVQGQLAIVESKIQGWIQTRSPYSPAARSTSFALLVWWGISRIDLIFFPTSCTLPHYKLHPLSFTVLSPALSPHLLQGQLEFRRGVFARSCSELRGQAKITLSPACCLKQLPPVRRGCIENVWEKTLKRVKTHKKGGEKGTARKLETNFKLWIISHPGSN